MSADPYESDGDGDGIVVNWTNGFEDDETDESTWSGDAPAAGGEWEDYE